ncbi:MAG: zinc ribbon domain-containing protein [Lachnospiraceae bacterium]|nr:zinc ribbon domain-containing protein [Lachnospiraceae bacterium]
MIFIGGISQGSKLLQYAGTLLCGFCGSRSRCQIVMTYYYFSFFFIPLFKWSRRYFVKMECCQAVYELDPVVGRAISRGEQVEIRSEDLRLVEEGKRVVSRYGQVLSPEDRDGQDGEEAADAAKTQRCPICKCEVPGDFNYCPKCGQRLR